MGHILGDAIALALRLGVGLLGCCRMASTVAWVLWSDFLDSQAWVLCSVVDGVSRSWRPGTAVQQNRPQGLQGSLENLIRQDHALQDQGCWFCSADRETTDVLLKGHTVSRDGVRDFCVLCPCSLVGCLRAVFSSGHGY